MKYCWASSLHDFVSLAERGWIPVLKPESASRATRWSRALEFYGERVESPQGRAVPTRAARAQSNIENDVVVVMSPELRVFADLFASMTHRAVHDVSSYAELSAYVSKKQPASAIIFAGRRLLDGAGLECLSTLNLNYGVVTGRDAAAVSFFVAKLLADRPAMPASRVAVDVFNARVTQEPGDMPGLKKADLSAATLDCLANSRWESAALVCHGDGSHLDLGPVVGCGAADVDRDNQGASIVGCEGAVSCKRSQNGTNVLRLSSVQAEQIWLLTCWGFAVAGEIYPSDSSVALDLAEGPARAIVAARALVSTYDWVVPIAFDLQRQRVGLGSATHLLNDLMAPSTGHRPLTLFGDPAGASWPATTVDEQGLVRTEVRLGSEQAAAGRGARYFYLGAWNQEVLGVSNSATFGFVRGTQCGVVFAPANQPVSIEDRTEAVSVKVRRLEDITLKLRGAALVQQWFTGYFKASTSNGLPDWIAELSQARLVVERGLVDASAAVNASIRFRTWNDAIEKRFDVVEDAIDSWDKRMAEAVREHWALRSITIASDLWHDPLFKQTAACESRCPACGQPLERTIMTAFPGDAVAYAKESCVIHQLHQLHPNSGGSLKLDSPEVVRGAERQIRLFLSVQRGAADVERPGRGGRLGWLTGAIQDKAMGATGWWYDLHEPLAKSATALEITLPKAAKPDRHVIRFAWVHDLQLHLVRRVVSLVIPKN